MHLFKKNFSRFIGYPIHDYAKSLHTIKTIDFLNESQFWSEDKIHEYQVYKLKKLIDYAGSHVPYYEELFKNIGLSSKDINKVEDIVNIPILTKEILRNEGDRMLSRQFSKFKLKKGKTGGTTGSPLVVYKDVNNRSFTWASYYRWYEWMGLNYYDPKISLWGAKTVLSKSLTDLFIKKSKELFFNEITFNSFNMKDDDMWCLYKKIVKNKPVLLKGYLSALIRFAQFIVYNNLTINGLRAISTTTETLLPHNRTFLQDVFKAPIYDQYGCGEVSAISYECKEHKGLHINQEHVICEILNNSDEPVENKVGNVVATDLDNLVMPFIRFNTGDKASILNGRCSCGVKQPIMSSIEGRAVDNIVLNDGNAVHGVFFTDILFELGITVELIQRFQVYQSEMGVIEFRIESVKKLDSKTIKKLELALLTFFDDVKLIFLDELPSEANGKFKYIINDLKL